MTTRRWFLVAVDLPRCWPWALRRCGGSTRPAASAGPGVVAVARPSTPARRVRPGDSRPVGTRPRTPGPTTIAARPATAPAAASAPGPGRLVIPGWVWTPQWWRSASAPTVRPRWPSRTMSRRSAGTGSAPDPGTRAGAAVLAGHVDGAGQGRGAMYRVRELGPGDRIEVELADGQSVGYRVIAKETIVKKRLPVERLFARDGPPRLVLITCGGPFVESCPATATTWWSSPNRPRGRLR